MGLRCIDLKKEYRSDREDVINDFFIPCLHNCVQYDRCIEHISLKSLISLSMGLDGFCKRKTRMRIITGHKFGAHDLNIIAHLFEPKKTADSIHTKDSKIKMLKTMIDSGQLEMKIAVLNSEEIAGAFTERTGIFTDETSMVAFTGTSNETFNAADKNFESIDVFTSWDDEDRVETKTRNFDNIWKNKTDYLDVFSFEDAIRYHLIKYSSRWALAN